MVYAAHDWWNYLLASSPRVFALGGQRARAARRPTTEAARESLATWSSPAHDHGRMVRRMQENGMRAKSRTPSFWGHLRCRPAPCRDADRLASKASQESRGHPDLQHHKEARALGVGVGCCIATGRRCVTHLPRRCPAARFQLVARDRRGRPCPEQSRRRADQNRGAARQRLSACCVIRVPFTSKSETAKRMC